MPSRFFPRSIDRVLRNWFSSSDVRRSRPLIRRNEGRYSLIESLEERLVLDVSAPAVLQIFESTYDNLEDRSADIFQAGFGAVWLPPTGRADSGNQSVGYDVFDRFDLGGPGNPTLYGTETGLKTSVDVLQAAGMQVYVDFLLNHNGFRDANTPGFVDEGGYPGFAVTLPGDADGDFNNVSATGDIDGRLAGLIDIDQQKDHQFIRHPTDAANPNNIAAGTVHNIADPANARFYPDQDLPPILLFNPITGQMDIPVHPFNTADPAAGDAVSENALGLLMRNAQWLVQEIGVDGFRLDAVKHFETFVLEFFDQAVYRSNLRPQLDGSTEHVFSFSEVFDGDKAFQQSKIRKDIDPGDPGRIGGNRDVLDFPLFFAMNANLTDNGVVNDWRNIKNASQDVQDDGLANNGSQGVAFVSSHDSGGAFLDNVAHAYVLMRPGNAVVYFNAEEFGQGRSFPHDGRGDALGGQFGDVIPTLVDIRNTHGRGDYIDRTPVQDEKEMLIFERSASALTVLSNRVDPGFDERTVQTSFLPGTPLIELTGNAADAVIDPFNDFPEVLVVNSDGTVNLRVPRNVAPDGTQHNSGYFIYGASGPQGSLSLSQGTPITSIPAETATPTTNGTSRIAEMDIITDDVFHVVLDTVPVSHLGSIRDQFADGDNALLRIDDGIDVNGNGVVDFTTVGDVSFGFEEFTTLKFPGFFESDGFGAYVQQIDTTKLTEGRHFIEVRAFRHREPNEGEAIYAAHRKAIYVDRLKPDSGVAGFDPIVPGVNENRELLLQSIDKTADNIHVFLDLPGAVSDADILNMLDGSSQTTKLDRDLWTRDFSGLTSGNHAATVVSFEISGNVNVQRIGGLSVSGIFGAGIGDLDFDGQVNGADILQFESVIQSNNAVFNPAADFNGDGYIDAVDLSLFHQQLLTTGATSQDVGLFEEVVDRVASLDYGDADTPPPSSYPSRRAVDGARHILNAGPFLGSAADGEPDALASELADGDDASGVDDEDGVTIPARFLAGRTTMISVEASGDGLLNAFFDFNADGDWTDSGEQIATDLPLSAGVNSVPVSVPQGSTAGETWARFRFDTFGNLGPAKLASNGEVEDYVVRIDGAQSRIVDDTQDTALLDGIVNTAAMEYIGPTSGAGNSFGGVIGDGITRLFVDSSGTGTLSFGLQPSTPITGGGNDVVVIYIDNGSGSGVTSTVPIADYAGPSERAISGDASAAAGDESDLTFAPGFTASHAVSVEGGFIGLWTIAGDGSLDLIAGRTNNGSFDLGTFSFQSAVDPGDGLAREWAFDLAALGIGSGDSFRYFGTLLNSAIGFRSNEFAGIDAATIVPPLPADPHIGQNAFSLLASDFSEFVTVPPPLDYGDAPATTLFAPPLGGYKVTIADDGARHAAVGPQLGQARDVEVDGIHDPNALGDDADVADDEDGVTFIADSLVMSELGPRAGRVDIELVNPNPAANFVDAWIDFNENGRFSDPGEQILSQYNLGTAAGAHTAVFAIPQDPGTNGYFGDTFARVRLSTVGGLLPTGFAADGEVEDHKLTILGELRLVIDRNSISENNDHAIATLTRSRGGTALPVNVSSLLGEVTFEETLGSGATTVITIPAGMTSTTFVINGVDNALIDGIRTETISVSAMGFGSASAMLDVTSEDALFLVTITDDESDGDVSAGDLSLREAIEQANLSAGTDEVRIAEALRGQSFVLAGTQLEITDDVLISGLGWSDTVIGGGQLSRVLHIENGADVTIRDVTVRDGDTSSNGAGINLHEGSLTLVDSVVRDNLSRATGPSTNGNGGGIRVSTDAGVNELTLVRSSLISNVAEGLGGGIDATSSNITIIDTTISGNSAGRSGGGAFIGGTGTTDVINSTFSGNTAADRGGGLFDIHTARSTTLRHVTITGNRSDNDDDGSGNGGGFYSGSGLIIHNTLIAGNFMGSGTTPSDIEKPLGSFSAGTHNLVGDANSAGPISDGVDGNVVGMNGSGTLDVADVLETVLKFNGGPTQTHALLPSGPAIDAGDNAQAVDSAASPLNHDQRGPGHARLVDGDNSGTATVDIGAFEYRFVPALEVSVASASVSETAGAAATTATVTRNTSTLNPLTVSLSSSDTSEATFPPSIVIPAGQTSVTFDVDAVDDSLVDGSQSVTVTASAVGHANGVDTLEVTDDEVPELTLSVAALTIREDGGTAATTATVTRNTDPSAALVVMLMSSDTSELAVPATITIPAGQLTSAPFDIDAVDDSEFDGSQSVTVTAAVAGHADGTQIVDVLDDEIPDNLFLNELLVDPDGLPDNPHEYIEIRGSADQPLPGVFLVFVEGDAGLSQGQISAGQIFDLSAAAIGSNGFLTIVDGTGAVAHSYSIAAGTTVVDVNALDIENASWTAMLIHHDGTGSDPTGGQDMDSGNDGLDVLPTGWTLLDSVSVLDGGASDRGYAPLVFGANADGLSESGAAFVNTGFGADNVTHLMRKGDTTGSAAADWVAFDHNGTAPNFTVADRTDSDYVLGTVITDHIGASNPLLTTGPEVNLSANATTGREDAGTIVTITATAASPVTGDQTVTLAVSGTNVTAADLSISSLTITIPDGTDTGSTTLTVLDDALVEAPETATVVIQTVSAGIEQGTVASLDVSIVDDDVAVISVASVSLQEGDSGTVAFNFAITLDTDVDTTVSFDFATSDDSATTADGDYDSNSGNLARTGDSSQQSSIAVTVHGDKRAEPDETFHVTFDNIQADGRRVTFVGIDASTQLAWDLDQQLGFFDDNSRLDNDHVQNEKWFKAANNGNQEYFILPNGNVIEWDNIPDSGNGVVIASLTSAFHADESLLTEARLELIATGTILNDDVRGVTVSNISGDTSEAGDTATFTVVLDTVPTADVTIALSSDDTGEGTVSPTSLTFTPSNWDTAQTVTVTGVDDQLGDGNVSFNIVLDPATGGDYTGIDPPDVMVVNQDDDGELLDVDGNGAGDAATDGILIIRYLFGFRGPALISSAVGGGASRTTAADIEAALAGSMAMMDADGNGVRDAATDGILIIRYLFGFRDAVLVAGAVGPGAVRTTGAAVAAFLDGYAPPPPAPPTTAASSAAPPSAGSATQGATSAGPAAAPPPPAPRVGTGAVSAPLTTGATVRRTPALFQPRESFDERPMYVPDEDPDPAALDSQFAGPRGWLDAL